MWITAATRAALPQNKTGYKKYSNKAITHPNLSLNAATYLGWLFTELGQQTENIDIQVRTPSFQRTYQVSVALLLHSQPQSLHQ